MTSHAGAPSANEERRLGGGRSACDEYLAVAREREEEEMEEY